MAERQERLWGRRAFMKAAGATSALALSACAQREHESGRELIIDIHQHTNYHGRSDAELIAHQRAMGIAHTILLPAGSKYGLAARCGGNDTVQAIADRLPSEYSYFANELPDLPTARDEIARYLDRGAIGIGEQKFPVLCDSPAIDGIATLAAERDVPILLHFQHQAYNMEFGRFHKILERYPNVSFIGHAQTFWGHIDKRHDPAELYPKDTVEPGGLTDRYLADYPNMYGDLSAGSGLNSLLRDEQHAAAFLERHQDKLMYGSDCADAVGVGEECQGAQTIAAIRRLTTPRVRRKIFYENAKRLLRLSV